MSMHQRARRMAMEKEQSRGYPPSHPSRSQGTDESSRDVEPPTRGPGSHSNNPYLLEHSYGLGVLAQRDPVSIRLRVSNRVEAIPPPPESGGALGGPGIRQNMRGGGRPPPGVGPDTPVCAQRVLKTRPRLSMGGQPVRSLFTPFDARAHFILYPCRSPHGGRLKNPRTWVCAHGSCAHTRLGPSISA